MVDTGSAASWRSNVQHSGWHVRLALSVLSLVSLHGGCASARATDKAPAAAHVCPAGTFDYGDGMVASLLPESTTDALTRARMIAVQAAGDNQSDFLRDQPWRPHVSVIYGVTPERAAPAHRALLAFVGQGQQVSACMGGLQYWDDPKGGKTTVVVDVLEPQGVLGDLHDALARAAHIGSRFAYHPHVTLIYLQLGTRYSPDQEAAVLAPLQGLCWPGNGFYLTDPCGRELHRVEGA